MKNKEEMTVADITHVTELSVPCVKKTCVKYIYIGKPILVISKSSKR